MSETGFQNFNVFFSAAADLIYAVCLALFIRGFLSEQEHGLKRCAAVVCTYVFLSWLCGWIAAPQGMFPFILILLLTRTSKALGLEKPTAFLLGLLFWETKISSALTVESLFFAAERVLPYRTEPPVSVYSEQSAYFVERQQTRAIRMRIHEAEQFYGRIREMKHEMRGHLTNIKGLARSGEYESLEDYVSRMDESISGFALTLQTGKPVTDVIINDIRRQCQESGIRFQADFRYPASGGFDAFDLGIILQNLLQNALEACKNISEGERFISLAGKQKGRFFLIEAQNTFAGKIRFGQDGLPATTKTADAPMHGIGLSNVRRTAEKYMGEMDIHEGKRRRQIAAAQSRGQVQQVLALLQKDLSDCKAGLEKDWCDESEIARVEALIAAAKDRMSQVPQESRKDSQGGLDAFAMASLM